MKVSPVLSVLSCLPDSVRQYPRCCLCWRLAVTLQTLHCIRSQTKPDPVAVRLCLWCCPPGLCCAHQVPRHAHACASCCSSQRLGLLWRNSYRESDLLCQVPRRRSALRLRRAHVFTSVYSISYTEDICNHTYCTYDSTYFCAHCLLHMLAYTCYHIVTASGTGSRA